MEAFWVKSPNTKERDRLNKRENGIYWPSLPGKCDFQPKGEKTNRLFDEQRPGVGVWRSCALTHRKSDRLSKKEKKRYVLVPRHQTQLERTRSISSHRLGPSRHFRWCFPSPTCPFSSHQIWCGSSLLVGGTTHCPIGRSIRCADVGRPFYFPFSLNSGFGRFVSVKEFVGYRWCYLVSIP